MGLGRSQQGSQEGLKGGAVEQCSAEDCTNALNRSSHLGINKQTNACWSWSWILLPGVMVCTALGANGLAVVVGWHQDENGVVVRW